jgi:hypothetical protein
VSGIIHHHRAHRYERNSTGVAIGTVSIPNSRHQVCAVAWWSMYHCVCDIVIMITIVISLSLTLSLSLSLSLSLAVCLLHPIQTTNHRLHVIVMKWAWVKRSKAFRSLHAIVANGHCWSLHHRQYATHGQMSFRNGVLVGSVNEWVFVKSLTHTHTHTCASTLLGVSATIVFAHRLNVCHLDITVAMTGKDKLNNMINIVSYDLVPKMNAQLQAAVCWLMLFHIRAYD